MAGKGRTGSNSLARTAEARVAPRVTLLLRVAKLVVDGCEFPCVLRDVSPGGIRARLFVPLPDQAGCTLELGNGARFAIEPVWQRDGEAGFRFREAPVDLALLIEEPSPFPRRHLRLRLEAPLLVHSLADDLALSGRLTDLSQHGAAAELGPGLALRQLVRLELPGCAPIDARLRWRRGTAHGLVFDRCFRLDELAELARRLQDSSAGSVRPAIPIG
jgi:hypothetical protein